MIVIEDDKVIINGEEHAVRGFTGWSIDHGFRWDPLQARRIPDGFIDVVLNWQSPCGVEGRYEAFGIPTDDFQDLRSC